MIVYRLHFEPANLRAIELIQSGVIVEPRIFSSSFSKREKESRRESLFRSWINSVGNSSIFSNCILERKTPQPSGLEGLADVENYRSSTPLAPGQKAGQP
jgi:hypothetical protein